MSKINKSSIRSSLSSNKGQTLVEYVIILTFAVGLAIIITTALVGRGENSGAIILQWDKLNKTIGSDLVE